MLLASQEGKLHEQQLHELAEKRREKEEELEKIEAEWQQAAEECRQEALGSKVPEIVARLQQAARQLEEHRSLKGGLQDVVSELNGLTKLLSKRRALEDIVRMAEETDAAREKIFAFDSKIDLGRLLELCERLPSRSKAVGLKRLSFLLEPLHRNLTQQLLEQLTWPKEGSVKVNVKALELCDRLKKAQALDFQLRHVKEDCWACEVLCTPLIARFRHHFARPESELCRMDKPRLSPWSMELLYNLFNLIRIFFILCTYRHIKELRQWAFKYLTELAVDHVAELEAWISAAGHKARERKSRKKKGRMINTHKCK